MLWYGKLNIEINFEIVKIKMAKSKNKNLVQNIKNLWQGKVSLVWTFWFWFMLIGSIVTIPSFLLTDAYMDSLNNLSLVLFIIFFLFQYAYLILAYVGTWRSASNFKPKKNQWSWGTIAKVYVVLNAIRAVVKFLN